MKKSILLILVSTLMLITSCDLLNCTETDVSALRIELCDINGNPTTLSDTLTVRACGTEMILLNRSTNTKEILLPLSYHAPVDTFILLHYGKSYAQEDSLFVSKTNNVYFESPDCPTVMMHTLQSAECPTAEFIASVSLENQKVNFEEKTHIRLFIKQ